MKRPVMLHKAPLRTHRLPHAAHTRSRQLHVRAPCPDYSTTWHACASPCVCYEQVPVNPTGEASPESRLLMRGTRMLKMLRLLKLVRVLKASRILQR